MSFSAYVNILAPCNRHKHWHTGDILTDLVGFLVKGFTVCVFRLGTGAFLEKKSISRKEKLLVLFVCKMSVFYMLNIFAVTGECKWIKNWVYLRVHCFWGICVICLGLKLVWNKGFYFTLVYFFPVIRFSVTFTHWQCHFISILQEAIIGGLQSETAYSVTVAAYTTKGDGARSKAKVITTTGAGQRLFS